MILPKALPAYSQANEEELRRSVREADRRNRKVGQNLDLGREEMTLLAPDGSRWAIKVDNTGALSTEARS